MSLPNEAPTAAFAFERGEWVRERACRIEDADLFYSELEDEQDEARRICVGCAVRADCFEQAMLEEGRDRVDLRFGIRAGTTPEERHAMHRNRVS